MFLFDICRLCKDYFRQLQMWVDKPYEHGTTKNLFHLSTIALMDKAALWGCAGVGGGSACCMHFCPYCDVSKYSQKYQAWVQCLDCQRLDPDNDFDCYHNEFMTGTKVKELSSKIQQDPISQHLVWNESKLKNNGALLKVL